MLYAIKSDTLFFSRQANRVDIEAFSYLYPLADSALIGGLAPMLGDQHLRVATVRGFPTSTWPGILDDLNRLGFAYRWSTRFLCLDKADAEKELSRLRRQWFAKRKSITAILKEVMTNESSTLLDSDAHNKALDADAALQELGHLSIRLADPVLPGRDVHVLPAGAVPGQPRHPDRPALVGEGATPADHRLRRAREAVHEHDGRVAPVGARPQVESGGAADAPSVLHTSRPHRSPRRRGEHRCTGGACGNRSGAWLPLLLH